MTAPAASRTQALGDVARAVRAGVADLPPGSLVLVAVSGGADSLACAAGLAAEAPRLRLRAAAVIVDHGLQPTSAAIAGRAAGTCSRLGLDPVVVERVAVEPSGEGPEAAARTARYAVISAVADRLEADAVLIAHTLDDQAETVLLGLARGSGARSLAGMPPRRGVLRRPLLGLRRTTTVAACEAAGVDVWTDPHNDDPAYTRVRVRRDALPVLEASIGPGIAEALARTAELLRADADALDEVAAAVFAQLGDAPLPCRALAERPAAVRTRVLRLAALKAGVPTGRLTAGHLGSLDRLVTSRVALGPVRLPGGLEASVGCDRLWFR